MREVLALIRVLILAAVAAASFFAGRRLRLPDLSLVSSRPIHSDSAPTLEAVRMLSSLVVSRVAVADVSQTRIDGYLGGITAIVVIHGDFLLGVDLAAAEFATVDAKLKSVVMTLPPPTAASPRLDQERTRVLCTTRQGLWLLVPGDAGQTAVVNHALRHAQEVVAAAGADPKLREEARRHAESTLSGFFAAIGWKLVVRWTDRT